MRVDTPTITRNDGSNLVCLLSICRHPAPRLKVGRAVVAIPGEDRIRESKPMHRFFLLAFPTHWTVGGSPVGEGTKSPFPCLSAFNMTAKGRGRETNTPEDLSNVRLTPSRSLRTDHRLVTIGKPDGARGEEIARDTFFTVAATARRASPSSVYTRSTAPCHVPLQKIAWDRKKDG